jgi:hypothetical protein
MFELVSEDFSCKFEEVFVIMPVLKSTYRCKVTNQMFEANRESNVSIRKIYPIF